MSKFTRTFTEAEIQNFYSMIGKKVTKSAKNHSGKEPKPFKSGNKVNTVRDVIVSPITSYPTFIFVEDDSFVDCHICDVIPE